MSNSKPTRKLTWDEQHLLYRAEEARTMADEIRHPECKRIMIGIADSYEYLARQTEEFHRAIGKPRSQKRIFHKGVPSKRHTIDERS